MKILLSTTIHIIIESITNIYHDHRIHHHRLSLSSFSHPYHEHHSSTIDHILLLLQMNRLHVYIILCIDIKTTRNSSQQQCYTITIYSLVVLQTNSIKTNGFWYKILHIIIRSRRSTNTRRGEERKNEYNYYKEEENYNHWHSTWESPFLLLSELVP